jgi:hypothetical protein
MMHRAGNASCVTPHDLRDATSILSELKFKAVRNAGINASTDGAGARLKHG